MSAFAMKEIVNAPTREAALEAALRDARAYALHWDEDRKCNLTITPESVVDCLAVIDAALAKSSANPT